MSGRKGLVEGVGREVFEAPEADPGPVRLPTGEMRLGSVPALSLLLELSDRTSASGTRSGKESCEGDSGIRCRGELVPEVGGPHMLGERVWP